MEWEVKEINKLSTGLCPSDLIYKSRLTLVSRILSATSAWSAGAGLCREGEIVVSIQPGLTARAAGTPSATVPTSSLGKGFSPCQSGVQYCWQFRVSPEIWDLLYYFKVLPHQLFSSPKWYQIPVFF